MLIYVLVLLGITLLILLIMGLRIINEYERAVVFRLGRFRALKGPGLFWILAIFDEIFIIDLRVRVLEFSNLQVMTRDNVTLTVDASVFYAVPNPAKAVILVKDYKFAVEQVTQTTLRSVIGASDLDAVLSEQRKINQKMQIILHEAAELWGLEVSRVELKNVTLPLNMVRAIAKQAESERERRRLVNLAEGELQASKILAKASTQIKNGISLRTIQTIDEIAREDSKFVIIPYPDDLSGNSSM